MLTRYFHLWRCWPGIEIERHVAKTVGNWLYYVVIISYRLIYYVIVATVSSVNTEPWSQLTQTSEAKENRIKGRPCQLLLSHLRSAKLKPYCVYSIRGLPEDLSLLGPLTVNRYRRRAQGSIINTLFFAAFMASQPRT